MLRRVEAWLRAIEARLEALGAWTSSRDVLRVLARLRRWQGALLTAAVALGILLMVVHWSGSARARPVVPAPARRAAVGVEAQQHAPAVEPETTGH
jgi:hypothetical protein